MILARYPTDLTDSQWAFLAPLIPPAKAGGRPRSTDMREVVNAVFYVLRGGCLAPAAEGLPALSDGLRLLSKLAVVGDMGKATRQTARGCAGSPWPQSGAERSRRFEIFVSEH